MLRDSGKSLVFLGLAFLLMSVTALLFGNIVLMILASNFNDQVCARATRAGAIAIAQGADGNMVTNIVGCEIARSPLGGFFIEQPILRKLSLESIAGAQRLTVRTSTRARLPAPILLAEQSAWSEGLLVFSKTYTVTVRKAAKSGPFSIHH